MLSNAQFHFATNLEWRTQEHIECVIDRAFRRVLDGNETEFGASGFHFTKHLRNGGERQGSNGMTKVLVHGLLSERAFGPEERNLERLLLRKTRRHDFSE